MEGNGDGYMEGYENNSVAVTCAVRDKNADEEEELIY